MIHIIGAGWYGCFIGNYLATKGVDYLIWEKDKIFSGASGYNQNRLHQGFHYPRSYLTRVQSNRGFDLFVREFADLIFEIPKNLYVIDKGSIIDFETYKTIFEAEGYYFSEVNNACLPIGNYDGVICVNELGICPIRSANYWRKKELRIQENVKVNIYDGALHKGYDKISKRGDKIIDCTWGAFPDFRKDYYVEKFMVLRLLKKKDIDFGALTLMDGPFFSIFPEDSSHRYYTLTCVALGKIDEMDERNLIEIVNCNLDYVRAMYTGFDDDFEYVGFYIGRKLKPKSDRADSRVLCSAVNNDVLTIFSGKIDAIFECTRIVDGFIES